MEENRQAIIEMISRTKDHKRMNVLIKHYIHLFHPRTLLTNVLVNLVNDIIENERKEDNKMENLRNDEIKELLNNMTTDVKGEDVKIEYDEYMLSFHAKTLLLMNGLKDARTDVDVQPIMSNIMDKLKNDITITGLEKYKNIENEIKQFIIFSVYRVTLLDFIKFTIGNDSNAESSQLLNLLDKEYSNEWKGVCISE